jgi:hypothetical protein
MIPGAARTAGCEKHMGVAAQPCPADKIHEKSIVGF